MTQEKDIKHETIAERRDREINEAIQSGFIMFLTKAEQYCDQAQKLIDRERWTDLVQKTLEFCSWVKNASKDVENLQQHSHDS